MVLGVAAFPPVPVSPVCVYVYVCVRPCVSVGNVARVAWAGAPSPPHGQPKFATTSWLSLSVDATFHVMFWTNVAAAVFASLLIYKMFKSLREAKAGGTGFDAFLLFPAYRWVLFTYLAVCLGEVVVLGGQGPYPNIPHWFYQAQYVRRTLCA
jgi:hypothetical protein